MAAFFVALLLLVACSDGDTTTNDGSSATTASSEASATSAADATTSTTEPPTTTQPPTTTAAPSEELELLGLGEFDVGVTTVTIDAESDRPLTVDVWFPIADGSDRPKHEYTFLPGIFYRSPNAVTATLDEISPDGPYPLIVYSHGSGGQRFVHSNYTETLASHGHIVVSADHTGNTLIESFVGAAGDAAGSAAARPGDIDSLLDAALGTDQDTELSRALASSLSDDPVVITGHSLGGFTSYASIAGLETETVVIPADERLGAVIALAPFATQDVLPDEALTRVAVPQLIIVGSDDKTTPIDPNVERLWELTAGSPTYRVELEAGEHLTFTDLCDYVTFLPELGTVPEFIVTELDNRTVDACAPEDMPIARAQALTNTFALRFLREFYDGDPFIDPAVEVIPDDVVFAVR